MIGAVIPRRPTRPKTAAYIPCPTMLSKLNQTPAAEIKPRMNIRNAKPSRW